MAGRVGCSNVCVCKYAKDEGWIPSTCLLIVLNEVSEHAYHSILTKVIQV